MKNMSLFLLILGDLLTLMILTIIGFATHKETGAEFLPRMFANFIPLSITWFAAAWSLGLFTTSNLSNSKQLWRPIAAAVFAAPLAAVFRGILLNSPVVPIFALVLSATTALGLLIWRYIWYQIH